MKSLCEVDVVVDVVDAEAVVPGAAGAVTEFQTGILRIRPAADRALMMIELLPLLLTDLFRSLAEVDGCAAGPARQILHQGASKEDHKVQA